jgi:hypothetical protein
MTRKSARRETSRAESLPEFWMANAARGGTTSRYNQTLCAAGENWSWRRDLNPRPPDYKSGALPAELRQPLWALLNSTLRSREEPRAQSQLYHSCPRRKTLPTLYVSGLRHISYEITKLQIKMATSSRRPKKVAVSRVASRRLAVSSSLTGQRRLLLTRKTCRPHLKSRCGRTFILARRSI